MQLQTQPVHNQIVSTMQCFILMQIGYHKLAAEKTTYESCRFAEKDIITLLRIT